LTSEDEQQSLPVQEPQAGQETSPVPPAETEGQAPVVAETPGGQEIPSEVPPEPPAPPEPDPDDDNPRVIKVKIEEEMKTSYINYAMSVIIGRAIPDVRDGLKPVHRRSLFAMWEMGNTHDKPYKKSARVVGEVMGKYHPHGDSSIYDTIVKMAQPFSYRYMLVDGQGNFGSIDGDAAAAMRYTEVRLKPIAEELLQDLDKETVDFIPNFDESLKEPVVLPAKVPNLLVNGSSGIAVGMATNMLPHNLREVCRALIQYIDNPHIPVDELMRIMPGPDFPTGGIIMGNEGIRSAYQTGQGKVVVRGVAEIEDEAKQNRIIITEIPFQVNKARLIEKIAELVKDKRIDGISDIRDESDKDGLRVVIELKRGAMGAIVLNHLYKHTELETSYGITNLAIVNGEAHILSLPQIFQHFVTHRIEVITRRATFEKRKAEERVHILQGLLLALDRIDEVIATIRGSETADVAREALVSKFGLTEMQANAILQMQLRRLAALEQKKILDEKEGLDAEIRRLTELLSDEKNIRAEIKRETQEIEAKYGDDRRTKFSDAMINLGVEDLIEDKPVLVMITSMNFIKRMEIDTYRQQRRGGKGITGMITRDEDAVENIFVANMHDYLLCFTNNGRAYWLKVYDVPESTRISKGKAIVNLLNLQGERVTNIIPIRNFSPDHYLLFATKKGVVAKIPQDGFSNPRSNGIYAITLKDDDELVDVKVTDGDREVILTTRFGRGLRFSEKSVTAHRRGVQGVRGMKLIDDDTVKALTVIEKDHLFVITDLGRGKRTSFDEFRGHGRGTRGVKNIKTDRNEVVVTAKSVAEDEELVVMSAEGIVIRTAVAGVSIQGRNTQGVRVMKLHPGDKVVAVAVVKPGENESDGEPADLPPEEKIQPSE